jgi:hypothetical protein
MVSHYVAVTEEGDMRRVLAGYGLADVAVTFVVKASIGFLRDESCFAAAGNSPVLRLRTGSTAATTCMFTRCAAHASVDEGEQRGG